MGKGEGRIKTMKVGAELERNTEGTVTEVGDRDEERRGKIEGGGGRGEGRGKGKGEGEGNWKELVS